MWDKISARIPASFRRKAPTAAAPPPKPYFLRFRSAESFIVAVVCIGVFTDIFLYGIIVPVVPFALTNRAGIPPANVQKWVSILLAVYGAGLLIASPIFGWMADRTKSRRGPFMAGLIALAVSTIMLCLGRSIGVLVVGRFLQGVSAAMVWSVGLALIIDTVGKAHVGEAMGWVSTSMSSALLLGPLLGGVVYDRSGYYGVYAMGFALVGLDIVLRIAVIEKKVAVQWIESGEENSSPATTTPPITDVDEEKPEKRAAVPTDQAITTEEETGQSSQSKKRPSAFLTLIKSPRTLAGLWGTFAQAVLITSFDSVLPIFSHRLFGFSSTGAGLLFLAIVIPNVVGPFVGMLTDRYGPRWIATGGFLLALPFFVLLRLVTHGGTQQIVLLCALLAFIGLSLAFMLPPVMAEFAADVDKREEKHPGIFGPKGAYAQSYGMLNMAYAAGIMVGPLWAGFLEQKAGWGTMTWTLGLLSGVSAIPMALVLGGPITWRRRRRQAEASTVENNGA